MYIKSQLSRDLKEIRREIRQSSRTSKEVNPENPFGLSTKENDIDELIKILMTFSYAYFNKENFSSYHTQVTRECE